MLLIFIDLTITLLNYLQINKLYFENIFIFCILKVGLIVSLFNVHN